jgi:hypothetical protein
MDALAEGTDSLGLFTGFVPCDVSEILTAIEPDRHRLAHPSCFQICAEDGTSNLGAGWPVINYGTYREQSPAYFCGRVDGAWKKEDIFYAVSFPGGLSFDTYFFLGKHLLALRKDVIVHGKIIREPPRPFTIRLRGGSVCRI